jgi:hypothetical protein
MKGNAQEKVHTYRSQESDLFLTLDCDIIRDAFEIKHIRGERLLVMSLPRAYAIEIIHQVSMFSRGLALLGLMMMLLLLLLASNHHAVNERRGAPRPARGGGSSALAPRGLPPCRTNPGFRVRDPHRRLDRHLDNLLFNGRRLAVCDFALGALTLCRGGRDTVVW